MSTPIDDDMSMPLSIEHEHAHEYEHESPILDEPPEEPVRSIVKKANPVRHTTSIEHFTPMNQYTNSKPNYKILLWVLLSSFLSNMVPESVISGLSKMVPEKASMVAVPLTRAVMAVVIYAILNFLVQ